MPSTELDGERLDQALRDGRIPPDLYRFLTKPMTYEGERMPVWAARARAEKMMPAEAAREYIADLLNAERAAEIDADWARITASAKRGIGLILIAGLLTLISYGAAGGGRHGYYVCIRHSEMVPSERQRH